MNCADVAGQVSVGRRPASIRPATPTNQRTNHHPPGPRPPIDPGWKRTGGEFLPHPRRKSDDPPGCAIKPRLQLLFLHLTHPS